MTLMGIFLATTAMTQTPREILPFAHERIEPDAGVLENPNFNLMVLEIQEAHGGETEPLEATVTVLEVLRGRPWKGETAVATWDHYPWWTGKTFETPEPGRRFFAGVLSAELRDGTRKLTVVRAFDASPENLRVAAQNMAPPEPSPWPVVWVATLGCVLLALAYLSSSTGLRLVLGLAAVLSALGTLVLYYDYEAHMSPYTTIRIDIFVVWPAVAAALAIPFVAWWALRRRRRLGEPHGV